MKACSKVLAIAVTPPWVKLEIAWILEGGRLSKSDRSFLERIARKKGLSELSDRQIARLSRLQGGDCEVVA